MLIVTKFKQVFLDTNVLIYHTFENFDSEKHAQVKQVFSFLEKFGSELFISRQVLREFYAISTNSKFFDEPLTIAEACNKLEEFSEVLTIVPDAELDILLPLLTKYQVKKQKIHDANLVATMLQAQIENIYTFNLKDFKVFDAIHLIKQSDVDESRN
jgi:predicted nucleic acid-binding protein